MAGAVVNCVNIRLNAPTVAFLLDHSLAEVVMVDDSTKVSPVLPICAILDYAARSEILVW